MSEEATPTSTPSSSSNPYLMPGAIVLAGLVIAGAIFAKDSESQKVVAATGNALEATVLPVTEKDHVFGSRDADVFLIEYSDYRCSYCGLFHDTISTVLEKYEGRIAWVYRHTPYQPGGKEASVASECVAELGGEELFWEFTEDALGSQRELSEEWYLAWVQERSIDGDAFTECVTSGRYDELIAAHSVNSQEIGGRGTPHNVLLTKNGDTVTFAGAQPIERVELFVERALKSLDS